MTFTICDSTVEPDRKRWITHRLGHDADGSPIELHLGVINGASNGPTLWLQGCLHGNEPVGGRAVRDVICGTDPSDVQGTIVGLPVANPTGFANKRRESQLAHVGTGDVNAVFPGSPDGPFPERLAHSIYSMIRETADIVVDVHSADEQVVMHTGFAYVPDMEDSVTDRTRTLATAAGVPQLVELPPDRIDGFLVAELVEEGIPAFILESGGGGQFHDFAYRRFTEGLTNVAKSIGILVGEPEPNKPTRHGNLTFRYASSGGFVEMAVRGGDQVSPGDHLGEITDLRGRVVETITASVPAHVLAIRSYPAARPGDMMIQLAPINED